MFTIVENLRYTPNGQCENVDWPNLWHNLWVAFQCPLHTEWAADDDGNMGCRPCEAGYEGTTDEARRTECTPCAAGEYKAEGELYCSKCAAGKSSGAGQSACDDCEPGTGTLGDARECIAAPVGHYLDAGVIFMCDAGSLHADCTTCGSASGLDGGVCRPCQKGTYSDSGVVCKPCQLGTPAQGYVARTTDGPADGPDSCLCPADAHMITDGRCKSCAVEEAEGLVCFGGAQFGRAVPFLKAGYFGRLAETGLVSSWVCHFEEACPAYAVAGVLQPVRETDKCSDAEDEDFPDHLLMVGVPCTRCPEQMYRDTTTVGFMVCRQCGPAQGSFLPLMVFFSGAVLVLMFKFSAAPNTQAVTSGLLASSVAGLIVNMLQTFNVIGLFNIKLPAWMRTFFDLLSVLMFDIDFLRVECVVGYELSARYTTQAVVPVGPALFGLTSAWVLKAHLAPITTHRIFNALGMLYSIGYIPLCRIAFKVFECRDHPSAPATMVNFPDIECDSKERAGVLGLGVAAILVYVVCILALFIGIVWKAPAMYYLDPNFRVASSFLIARWKPDAWWFGPISSVRNLCLALVPLGVATDGNMQLSFCGVIVGFYLFVQGKIGPWRDRLVDVSDALIAVGVFSLCFFTLGVGAITMDASELERRLQMYGHWFILSLSVMMCTTATLVIYAALYVKLRSRFLEATRARDVVLLLTRIGELAHGWTDADLQGMLDTMLTVREQKQTVNILCTIMNEVFAEQPGIRQKPRLLLQEAIAPLASSTLTPEERRRKMQGVGPQPDADEVEI